MRRLATGLCRYFYGIFSIVSSWFTFLSFFFVRWRNVANLPLFLFFLVHLDEYLISSFYFCLNSHWVRFGIKFSTFFFLFVSSHPFWHYLNEALFLASFFFLFTSRQIMVNNSNGCDDGDNRWRWHPQQLHKMISVTAKRCHVVDIVLGVVLLFTFFSFSIFFFFFWATCDAELCLLFSLPPLCDWIVAGMCDTRIMPWHQHHIHLPVHLFRFIYFYFGIMRTMCLCLNTSGCSVGVGGGGDNNNKK